MTASAGQDHRGIRRPVEPSPTTVDGACARAADVIHACVMRRGRLWWTEWDALQWSPINLVTHTEYHGAARTILATFAFSQGWHDRRWAIEDQLDGLGYRIRRADRTLCVDVGDKHGLLLYNAEMGRRKRSAGGRHDAPIAPEAPREAGTARQALETLESLVPQGLTEGGSKDIAHILRTMALSCVPRSSVLAGCHHDALALRALVADLSVAMALSDFGIVPSTARVGGAHGPDDATSRWSSIIADDPTVLLVCAETADTAVSVLLATLLVRASKKPHGKPHESGSGGGIQEKTSPPTSHQAPRDPSERETDSMIPRARLTSELLGTSSPRHIERGASGADTQLGYTLREAVAESERASAALALRGIASTRRGTQ